MVEERGRVSPAACRLGTGSAVAACRSLATGQATERYTLWSAVEPAASQAAGLATGRQAVQRALLAAGQEMDWTEGRRVLSAGSGAWCAAGCHKAGVVRGGAARLVVVEDIGASAGSQRILHARAAVWPFVIDDVNQPNAPT